FIAYENLIRGRRSTTAKGDRQQPAAVTATAPISQAVPLIRRALKILADREVTPQTGLLKSTLLQLDSTFSARNYGASSLLDLAEKVAKDGVARLKQGGRSVTVELNSGFSEDDAMKTRSGGETDDAAPPAQPTNGTIAAPIHSGGGGTQDAPPQHDRP